MDKTGQTVTTPASGYSPTVRTRGQTISQTVTSSFSFPGWFSGTTGTDASIDGPAACMAKCNATAACDHWSYEFERGYHECFLKATHTSAAHCDLYVTWAQHWSNGDPWGTYWEGYAGPKQCFPSHATASRAPYTTTRFTADGHGVTGGHASVGGRSFTIFSWDGRPDSGLQLVSDSGSDFETLQLQVNGGLCDGCVDVANATCANRCPFNSDEAPPRMDDRSDAKGPEPECVTTGVMSDGRRLAFIGLERTGGIMVYDVSNPAQPNFQDYLNVRNWRNGETINNDEVAKNLNDGPESLVFVSASDSPLGREMVLAATPLAGRLTAYVLEEGAARGNDGSCPDTASCPYLSVADGGTGTIRGQMNVCNLCVGTSCDNFPQCRTTKTKLLWVGDYQTGGWDTDAAEHVAYDATNRRAFVASAETGVVKVVDVTDPTAIIEMNTLPVGADMQAQCMEVDCIYERMDFGGRHNPCGYAPMIANVVNYGTVDLVGGVAYGSNGNYSFPSYVVGGGSASSWVVDATMTSPAACQALCASTTGCTFFSYEYEYQAPMDLSIHECFLKSDYATSDVPSGLTMSDCHHYTIWEPGPVWDQHYMDQNWLGAAGPRACTNFVSSSVQSVAVVSVPGYSNGVVVAASPSRYEFAAGYLSFYDALTLSYLGCREAGMKPEGLVSNGQGKVAAMNEGSMAIQECGAGQVARGVCSSGDDSTLAGLDLPTSHGPACPACPARSLPSLLTQRSVDRNRARQTWCASARCTTSIITAR